jgi:hypothetical protein
MARNAAELRSSPPAWIARGDTWGIAYDTPLLTTTGSVGADHILRYRASKRDSDRCPLKPRRCPKTPSRKGYARCSPGRTRCCARPDGTLEFDKSRDERKKVEMRFAHYLAAGAAALPAMSRSAKAQAFPTRPITMVVPFNKPVILYGQM